jgi:hypothetical protein
MANRLLINAAENCKIVLHKIDYSVAALRAAVLIDVVGIFIPTWQHQSSNMAEGCCGLRLLSELASVKA